MNKATKTSVATLGSIFGLSGISHGFFEALQGNTPIDGMFIAAIGEAHRMWPHGAEPAFTLIPNFLTTGIAAMLVGFAIMVWSIGFVHKKNGAAILLLLFVLLLLVGGGVAQVLFFPWICLVSTRIQGSLVWWKETLPGTIQRPLSKLWPWCLVISSALLVFVLQIAVTGLVPGLNDPEAVLAVRLLCLAAEIVLLPLTFLSGFAHDIAAQGVGE